MGCPAFEHLAKASVSASSLRFTEVWAHQEHPPLEILWRATPSTRTTRSRSTSSDFGADAPGARSDCPAQARASHGAAFTCRTAQARTPSARPVWMACRTWDGHGRLDQWRAVLIPHVQSLHGDRHGVHHHCCRPTESRRTRARHVALESVPRESSLTCNFWFAGLKRSRICSR